MHRRTFLKSSFAFVAARAASAQTASDDWRTFEVVTRIEITRASGITRAWLPLPSAGYENYQRVLTQRWRGSAPVLRANREERAAMLFAEWPANEPAKPEVELILQVATRDRSIDWSNRTSPAAPSSLGRYLSPVTPESRAQARLLTAGTTQDVGKARAVYEWAIDHSPARARGATFVRLARAAGVPARVVSGLSVGGSDVTTAQYERAEFYSTAHGWVPVDPAAAADPYRRRQMFGMWKAEFVALNESSLMQPRAESAGRPLEANGPAFRYTITAREIR